MHQLEINQLRELLQTVDWWRDNGPEIATAVMVAVAICVVKLFSIRSGE